MIKGWYVLCLLLLFFLLAGCTVNSPEAEQADYEETKKMLVDILKTDDGKTAIREVMQDPSMQQMMTLDAPTVSSAVQESLFSEKGKEFWTKLFTDSSFIQEFTPVLKEEQTKLLKGLMKDAEYQKMMIDLYKNPEMTEQFVTVLKGQKFREHLETTIKETLNNPSFKADMTEELLKAADEMQQQENGGGDSGGDGEQQQNQNQDSQSAQ
ncbi:spore germination lipoprotein GerD [Salimicrobium halophilum]|uniref:Spore germination protein D n=1 Tax=Salimicrobium halophilum TaxID=86666 RepID=A0A1G8VVF6_9BACI|nr:spore germination lipoprotein GerD [Salimicrobium halophilum]SDJ69966.1 spore germination protein D [Salimicrobium halophilum]